MRNLSEYIDPEEFQGDLAVVRDECGPEVARQLAAHMAGWSIYIPDRHLSAARQAAARDLAAAGWPVRRISLALGLKPRAVWRCICPTEAVIPQPGLFDEEKIDG